jgi:hypothetical protein
VKDGKSSQLQSLSAEDGRKIQYIRNPLGQITHAETWSANPGSTLDVAYDYSFDPSHRPANVTDEKKTRVKSCKITNRCFEYDNARPDRSQYQCDKVRKL